MSGRALQTLIALVLAGLWALGLGVKHWRGDAGFLERLEATMTDLRTVIRGEKAAPDLITIIAIDDQTARQEGGYPIPRASLARIVDTIASLEPKVIAVDLLLVDPGPESGDEALGRSLGRSKSVVAAAAVYAAGKQLITTEGEGPLARVPNADRFLLPLKRFADVAAVGVANVVTETSGTARFFPMLFRSGDRIEASLPLRIAAVASGTDPTIEADRVSVGGRSIRTDIGHVLPLNFYGPRGTVRTISAADVLNGRLARDSVHERVVVIGATVSGGGDVFPSAFDPVLPGAEIISTAIAHLMTDDGLVRDRNVRLADAALAVLLTMVVVGLLAWRRSAIGFGAIIAVVLMWLAVNMVAFWNGIWLSVALPMAAAVPPAILFGSAQIWLSRRRAQEFAMQSELLQRFQPPGLGEWLARHPDFLAEPVRENAAIVFIDLSGFTGLSETLGPTATRELLNDFSELVAERALACSGVVTSFTGDGAMIVFGLPKPTPADAFNAALCCVDLSNYTRSWLATLPESTASRIGFKVGAHFGAIVASRLGGQAHQLITATGDTVNVANRLMEVAAEHGAELALSDDMLQAAGKDSALFKSGSLSGPMETQIRGRSGSLAIWLWRNPVPRETKADVL
jgi:adenylate cyclase